MYVRRASPFVHAPFLAEKGALGSRPTLRPGRTDIPGVSALDFDTGSGGAKGYVRDDGRGLGLLRLSGAFW